MDLVLGVWCGLPTKDLLAPVGLPGEKQEPLVKLVLTRCRAISPLYAALIPWDPHYDALEEDLAGWTTLRVRCHPDERIAMRDLVASSGANIGALVYGTAATIDAAEVKLAAARLRIGIGDSLHKSARCVCAKAETWLLPGDTDDWVEPMSAGDLSVFYHGLDMKKIQHVEARAIRAKRTATIRTVPG